jgi:hypothetical protein
MYEGSFLKVARQKLCADTADHVGRNTRLKNCPRDKHLRGKARTYVEK